MKFLNILQILEPTQSSVQCDYVSTASCKSNGEIMSKKRGRVPLRIGISNQERDMLHESRTEAHYSPEVDVASEIRGKHSLRSASDAFR